MDEETDKGTAEELHDEGHDTGKGGHGQETVPETGADPLRFSGAHILAGVGGEGHAHGAEGLLDQLLEAVGGGIGSHGRGAEGVDDGLQRGGGDRDETPLQRQGQAEADGVAGDGTVEGEGLPVEAEIGIAPEGIEQGTGAGEELGQHGREGGAEHAPAEYADKQQIEAHVQDAGDHEEIQRRAGVAEGALHGGGIVVNRDERHGGGGHAHIGNGFRQDFRRGSHPGEHRWDHHEGHRPREDGGGQHDIGRVGDGLADHAVVAGAEVLGGDDAAAAADAVEDGKEKEGNGTGGPDGGQGIGAENLTHDHRIRQIVGLLEKIADEQGKSKNRKQGQGPAFCHIHGGRMPVHGCRLHRKNRICCCGRTWTLFAVRRS